MTLYPRTSKCIVYLLLIWPFNPPSKRSYPLRCQLYDQDIDRDRFCQMKDPSHNTKTQAFCGLWVVVLCPRDSIVMGASDWLLARCVCYYNSVFSMCKVILLFVMFTIFFYVLYLIYCTFVPLKTATVILYGTAILNKLVWIVHVLRFIYIYIYIYIVYQQKTIFVILRKK